MSMAIKQNSNDGNSGITEIVLVDDVITTGATILGAANRVKLSFPHARIRGFAALRSVSDVNQFSQLVDPRMGFVTLENYEEFGNTLENAWTSRAP